jgi:hypothetical protein
MFIFSIAFTRLETTTSAANVHFVTLMCAETALHFVIHVA